jgi:hypothetical protein
VSIKLISSVMLLVTATVSGQNRPGPGGWHGTRWGMAESGVNGIFHDKLRTCTGCPPSPTTRGETLIGVDCLIADGHRWGV